MSRLLRLAQAIRHISRAPEILRCRRESEDWITLTTAYLWVKGLRYPYAFHSRTGTTFRFEESYDLETFWQIYCRRVYDVRPGDGCILDLGANIGMFSCFAARSNPSCAVYAVEPFPSTYGRLTEHARLNGYSDRIHCLNFALNAAGGAAFMSTHGRASQMCTLVATEEKGATGVAAHTFSSLIDEVREPRIDLVKMDIEGAEYEVLLSTPASSLSRIGRIVLEYHEPPSSVRLSKLDIRKHLEACGFHQRHEVGGDWFGLLYFER